MNRAWMEVDLGALVRNAEALANHAGVPLIPMIKADAYGLGAVEVSRALEPLEPMAYGVATVIEGKELRESGITRTILILTPLLASDLDAAHASHLRPALSTEPEIRAWSQYDQPYALSIDTGMSRAGVSWREVASLRDVLTRHPPAEAFTHFHSSELDDGSVDIQETRFREALGQLPQVPPVIHTGNSAAIVRRNAFAVSAVRPGLFLYGVGSGETAQLQPEPVVYVKAKIVETRWIEPGETVSYDATWKARRRTRIATIPLGYADGYPRNASNTGVGVVRDSTVPIAGRVTMDMIMLDVTDAAAEVGDVVTMIGDPKSTGAPIDIGSVAAFASMSPYELLTGLRGRLERIYRR